MNISIMQPYFMPYIGYWQMMNLVDTFVLLDDVNFIKKGWINRNRILLNGEAHTFTLPLQKASQNKRINEISLSEDFDSWQRKFIQTLTYGYRKAPHFEGTMQLINSIFSCKERNLSLFLSNSLQFVAKFCGIGTNFICSSDIQLEQSVKGKTELLLFVKRWELINTLTL